MRTIYLDMCCFNRPYDDQTQTRIRLETQAKLELQDHVKAGSCHLLWSAALDYECSRNPYPDNQLAITQWRWLAKKIIEAGPEVVALAKPMLENGIKSYDALHVASAIAGGAGFFVTTDDRLLKNLRRQGMHNAYLPTDALAILENWYEN